MWICPRCQTSNKDSTNFCKRCGEYVADEAKQQDKSSEQAPQAPPAPPQRAQSGPAPTPTRPPQPQPRPQTTVPPVVAAPISKPINRPAQSQPQSAAIPPAPPVLEPAATSPVAPPAAAPKRPIINKKLLKAAQDQALENGETGDTEELIDWTSAATIAGAMRTQIKERRSAGGAVPTDLRDELFGEDDGKQAGGDLPPVAMDESFLTRVESAISKRVLLAVSAVSLVALIGTVIGSNSVINSFDEGVTPTMPAMSALRISTLSGVWLGIDRSQGSPGVPVTYLFTRPNWLIVTEPAASTSSTGASGLPSVVAEANYGLSGGTLSMQPIAASIPQLIPATAAASVKGDSVTITDSSGAGSGAMVLVRPAAIAGTWQASVGGKYEFGSNGVLTVTTPGAKPQTSAYTVAGSALRVTPSAGSTGAGTAQTWYFTFDGKNLLLYIPDPGNPSGGVNFGAPMILSHG